MDERLQTEGQILPNSQRKRGSSLALVLATLSFGYGAQGSGNKSKMSRWERIMLKGLLLSKLLTKIKRKPSDLEETFAVHTSDKMLIGSSIHRAYPNCNI